MFSLVLARADGAVLSHRFATVDSFGANSPGSMAFNGRGGLCELIRVVGEEDREVLHTSEV